MSGLIPQAFIDDILAKTDLIHLIDGYVPLKKQGTSYSACCPFHEEKTPSFNVIPKKQFYHCFGCGASGNAISFVMDYMNQSFPDAIETLATKLGIEVPREKSKQSNRKQALPLYELLEKVTHFYEDILQKPLAKEAATYLVNRGISEATCRHFHIGYAPPGWHNLEAVFKPHQKGLVTTGMLITKEEDNSTYDRYRQRIVFPIHNYNGQIIGFGGRAILADQKPKYLNSPETIIFQKSRELYGLYQVLEASRKNPESILVVEGYMDVVSLVEHGYTNVVATLGTATSTYHIQRLSRFTKHIIFCFDGDTAGQKAAFKALESALPSLDGTLNASFVFLPEGEDPDSLIQKLGLEAFQAKVSASQALHEFLIETLSADIDTQTLAGRGQLLKSAEPYLDKIPEGPYKVLLLEQLARITHLETTRIESTLKLKPQQTVKSASGIKRTPLRLAIALVLQNPQLYSKNFADLPEPDAFIDKEQALLRATLSYLLKHPEATTAQLIEAFRETKVFDAVKKLAAWQHLVPVEALESEFIETLNFLSRQHQHHEIEALIQKARANDISDLERQHLQTLLQNKHKLEAP